jgi:hypothetical protein
MKYQLVLQFQATTEADFDELVILEDALIENLPTPSEVDGHDFGSDEFNIFVLTTDPKKSYSDVERVIRQSGSRRQLKAAYRELGGNSFVILWPPTLQHFKIA